MPQQAPCTGPRRLGVPRSLSIAQVLPLRRLRSPVMTPIALAIAAMMSYIVSRHRFELEISPGPALKDAQSRRSTPSASITHPALPATLLRQ